MNVYYKGLVGRLSAKLLEKSSFVSALLVFARNAAPERAATEDKAMLPRTSACASKNFLRLIYREFRHGQKYMKKQSD